LSTERSDALAGAMLGNDYRVLERIGRGGMAVVYLVEHQTLLKRFAAKVLSNELASSLEARARFTQEAHAASQLDHENIVSISDFGVTADQRPFFVMELLRGQTLDQRLVDGPMTIEEVVAVSVPVARALAHAHAEGIVHCDVKPENIFLVQRSQGRWGVKVVDFGIARISVRPEPARTHPRVGETLGSPLFMAPEMIRGEDDIDQRTDVYSFGVLLFLMLCGRLPFYDRDLRKVMQMHLFSPVPPPRTVHPGLSAELAAILERALAKRADDRYPSMDSLLIDLEAALPAGSDRLLIEAQAGITLGENPFASTLAIAETDSQRRSPVGQVRSVSDQLLLRTIRVEPLPSPGERPRPAPPRAASSRGAAIVITSVLVSALGGGVAWWQIATHGIRSHSPMLSSAPDHGRAGVAVVVPHAEASAPVQPSTPAAPADTADTAPSQGDAARAAPEPPRSSPAAASPPASQPVATRSTVASVKPGRTASGKNPLRRPKPSIRREPARSGKRVAIAAVPASAVAAPEGPAAAPSAAQPETAPAAVSPGGDAPTAASAGEPDERGEIGAAATPEPSPPPPSPPPPLVVAARPTVAPGPGSLDAMPAVETLDVKGSLSRTIVRRSMERTLGPLRSCYRAAAREGKATPAIDLQLRFEVDENSLATHVVTSGGSFGSLARCAASVVGQVHTQEAPDVGTAQVFVVIRFRPTGPARPAGSQR